MTHQDMLAEYAQAKEKALGMGGPGKLAKRKAEGNHHRSPCTIAI
jgi:hypothetical protein